MTQKQSDDILMFNTVKLVLIDNTPIWTASTPFTNAVGVLQTNLTAINKAIQAQQPNIKGATDTKAQDKDLLINKTVALAMAGKAYAVANTNTTLRQACMLTKTDLMHVNETGLAEICQNLYDQLNPFIVSMNGYGVDTASQLTLQGLITGFMALPGTPRSVQSSSVAATENIVEEIINTKNLLDDQLDGLMEQYKETEATFYNAYHTARKKVTHGHRTKVVVEGMVTKAGATVANALVICMENGHEHKKITKENGAFHFLLNPPVSTLVTVSLTGFPDQVKTVDAKVAETLVVNFAF